MTESATCAYGHPAALHRYRDHQHKTRCRECERIRKRQYRSSRQDQQGQDQQDQQGQQEQQTPITQDAGQDPHEEVSGDVAGVRYMNPALFQMIGEVAEELGGIGWGAIHEPATGRPLCLWGVVNEAMRRLGRSHRMPRKWNVLTDRYVGVAYQDTGHMRRADKAICPVTGMVADQKVQKLLKRRGDVTARLRRSGSQEQQARFLGRVPWPELAAALGIVPRAHTHAGPPKGGEYEHEEHEEHAVHAAAA